MSVSESILIAIFTMAVVFAVFAMLWVLIRLFSFMIRIIEKNKG